jgi:hypothetical protein
MRQKRPGLLPEVIGQMPRSQNSHERIMSEIGGIAGISDLAAQPAKQPAMVLGIEHMGLLSGASSHCVVPDPVNAGLCPEHKHYFFHQE